MKKRTMGKDVGQPRLSDVAVRAKTGKIWKEWFSILDKAGAKQMTHQEIVAILNSKHGVGPWWQQMLTVTYEQARGMRAKHEKAEGFQISVSRTVNVPIATLYKSFANEKARAVWLDENGLFVRKTTANKSMRVTWKDGKTSLEIGFIAKAPKKSQVTVQHSKLTDAKSAARMKTYWSRALDRLQQELTG